MITIEGIALKKYPAICVPQACQGVDTVHAYTTVTSTKVFTHYITKVQLLHRGKISLIMNMSQRMTKHVTEYMLYAF